VKPDGEIAPAVLNLASTQIKKSKQVNSLLDNWRETDDEGSFNPPTFAHVFRVNTVPESNDQGNWMGWQFERVGFVEDENVYNAAKSFCETAQRGEVKVDEAGYDASEVGAGGRGGSRSRAGSDEGAFQED
jgi:hypothetical protein